MCSADEGFPGAFGDEDLRRLVVGGIDVEILADGDIFDGLQEGREVGVLGLFSDPLFQRGGDSSEELLIKTLQKRCGCGNSSGKHFRVLEGWDVADDPRHVGFEERKLSVVLQGQPDCIRFTGGWVGLEQPFVR
jgi:hypothetical protein